MCSGSAPCLLGLLYLFLEGRIQGCEAIAIVRPLEEKEIFSLFGAQVRQGFFREHESSESPTLRTLSVTIPHLVSVMSAPADIVIVLLIDTLIGIAGADVSNQVAGVSAASRESACPLLRSPEADGGYRPLGRTRNCLEQFRQ